MSKSLNVKITSQRQGETEVFSGTVNIPGLRPTKLVKKSDGTADFPSVSALKTTARGVARTLGFDGVEVAEPKRKAAKAKTKK